jgi:hypothetical protein
VGLSGVVAQRRDKAAGFSRSILIFHSLLVVLCITMRAFPLREEAVKELKFFFCELLFKPFFHLRVFCHKSEIGLEDLL